jgi:hypothetical protein
MVVDKLHSGWLSEPPDSELDRYAPEESPFAQESKASYR